MTGAEFIRRARRLGRRKGVDVSFDAQHGKGSHGTLRFGDRSTTVPYLKRELPRGLFLALCRQLDIDPEDLRSG